MFAISTYLLDAKEFGSIYKYIVSKSYCEQLTKDQKRLIRKKAANYEIIGDKLFRSSSTNKLLVIQGSELEGIFKEIHDNAGHQCDRYSFEISKTKINKTNGEGRQFYW